MQEWRSCLRVKQVYPLLKSSAERGTFSSSIFDTHLETPPSCQGSMSPPSIRKPLNVNREQNFWVAPRHDCACESHSRGALLMSRPFQLSEEPPQWGITARISFIPLLILIIALQPENTPRAVTKTLGTSHSCSASADSWPDQERV